MLVANVDGMVRSLAESAQTVFRASVERGAERPSEASLWSLSDGYLPLRLAVDRRPEGDVQEGT